MQVSILDQAPILNNSTAKEALEQSIQLAVMAEKLGYTRYWIAEHHNLSGLACSAPEIMLPVIGAKTKSIRIGSGATLLPHYKPYKVAEMFNMLATLFPNRIDLGIGRAPGGDAQSSIALSGNYLENVKNMPKTVQELLHFLYNDYPKNELFSSISASPLPNIPPEPWILGTSIKSAFLAAENGISYAFGQFMSNEDGRQIIQTYKNQFQKKRKQQPKTIVTVSAICAETSEKAEQIAFSSFLWNLQHHKGKTLDFPLKEEAKQQLLNSDEFQQFQKNMIIGDPTFVVHRLYELKNWYEADEMMILTITGSYEERTKSYQLIAEEINRKKSYR